MEQNKCPYTKINQIGIVVRDIQPVIEGMRALFGAEPKLADMHPGSHYRGQLADCTAQIAFYNFANIELEFIMPISGTSIWQDFLDAGHEGLHHLRFEIEDSATAVDDFAQKEVTVYANGSSVAYPGASWTYFDTFDKVKFIVETINTGAAMFR